MLYGFSVDGLVDATVTITYPVRDRGVSSAAITYTLAVPWLRSFVTVMIAEIISDGYDGVPDPCIRVAHTAASWESLS
jgi:hypothetical protein